MIQVMEDPDRQVVQQNLNVFLQVFEKNSPVFQISTISKVADKVFGLQNHYSKCKSLCLMMHAFKFPKHDNQEK